MAVHKLGRIALMIVADDILDSLQTAKSREVTVEKHVFDLGHPKADCTIDPTAHF